MFLLSKLQLFYIFIVIIVIFIILFLYFFPIIRKLYYRKKYIKLYYKVIDKLVVNNDYLLINNFIIKNYNIHINHIIFAKKYIYLIKDSYFEGAIEGKLKDNKWVYYQYKKHDISTVFNPFIELNDNLESLLKLTKLDKNLFYLINLINDDALISFESTKKDINKRIISKSNLIKFINELELSSDVKDINQDELLRAVNDIAHINERDFKINE